jgi:hypothetical protein
MFVQAIKLEKIHKENTIDMANNILLARVLFL